jgi:predicted AAA+ superfamily ATPase
MGKVSESLAGRASYLTLWPMTRREQLGLGQCGIWEELVAADESEWQAIIERQDVEKEDWRALALRGGFPTPAVELQTPGERAIWFDGYIRTYLERDLQDLSAIDALPDFRRLMRAACHRLGGMLNQANLGRDVAIPQPTVHRYLNLLEASYLLVRLPAYSVNRTKRLIKSPRLYWGDTGTALNLAERDEPGGEHLENIILNDILAWRDARLERAEVFYWRTQIGEEVDLVIETGGKLLPIEVKATSRPGLDDARHMRTFRSEYKNARSGLLLHTGDKVQWLASDVLAAPWWRVL